MIKYLDSIKLDHRNPFQKSELFNCKYSCLLLAPAKSFKNLKAHAAQPNIQTCLGTANRKTLNGSNFQPTPVEITPHPWDVGQLKEFPHDVSVVRLSMKIYDGVLHHETQLYKFNMFLINTFVLSGFKCGKAATLMPLNFNRKYQ